MDPVQHLRNFSHQMGQPERNDESIRIGFRFHCFPEVHKVKIIPEDKLRDKYLEFLKKLSNDQLIKNKMILHHKFCNEIGVVSTVNEPCLRYMDTILDEHCKKKNICF